MARSSLLRRFHALFEDLDEAERSSRPLEAVREQRRQMRLTRRDFLKATGATEQGARAANEILARTTSRHLALAGGLHPVGDPQRHRAPGHRGRREDAWRERERGLARGAPQRAS